MSLDALYISYTITWPYIYRISLERVGPYYMALHNTGLAWKELGPITWPYIYRISLERVGPYYMALHIQD